MKPVFIDIGEITESVEVYESKPNPAIVYTIYTIFLILAASVIWAINFKLDNVVKSNGVFKGTDSIFEVSSAVTGCVKEAKVEDGQFVEKGDVLFVVNIESLSETILNYQKEKTDAENRLEILQAYEKSLDSGSGISESLKKNPYYDEFVNKRKLLLENISVNSEDQESKVAIYQGSIDNINATIAVYTEKVEKLTEVKNCIINHENTFQPEDTYYYSMVNSYLASYNYNRVQYNNKISEYDNQVDECNRQILEAEDDESKEAIREQRDSMYLSTDNLENERSKALSSLETQQISEIEAQIESINNTLLTLNSNLSETQLELNANTTGSAESTRKIAILTEKGNVYAEELTYNEKKDECENYLTSYGIQNDNCTIRAASSGYYYSTEDVKVGTYLQESSTLGKIYPKEESDFYAEIFVENSDIGKIKEGQNVKFEIAAFPSREYGYFKGTVSSISKDITVNQTTGEAYYIVKVACSNMTLSGKDGTEVSLKNGMSCTGKIIVGERSVMDYILEKIHLKQ
ncbi:MAG: HlyD family efflux transporter periplasmic adaptor subunit [Pseudobutyrivibrio sp.]|nr:HlyD family efflux transporter periplasmic adaptor subunit [Pseudobutyrivibrio sp.]